MPDLVAACVMLTPNGLLFHPGPPEGEEFEGLTPLATIVEESAGTGANLRHPDVPFPLPVGFVFHECRKHFKRDDINTLNLFVEDGEEERWSLEGTFQPPGVLRADA